MKRFFCITIVLLYLSDCWTGHAQTIHGTVTSAEDNNPVTGAIVRLTGPTGTLAYQMTDTKGVFFLSVPEGSDSLRITFLGFKECVYSKPFETNYRVSLVPEPRQIRESIITAQKVETAGDTIRFHVKALVVQEDRVLSDVLNRLPGVEVSPAGYVKYYGRAINRFYINGRDVLEGNYNLATKSLPINAVKNVEVLENHQPIKMLRGVKSTDRAAINVVLEEKSASKLIGGIELGAGISVTEPRFPVMGHLSAFYTGHLFSSVNSISYDSLGHSLQENEEAEEENNSYYHYPLSNMFKPVVTRAPLEDKRSLFNKTFDASSVEHISVNESSSFGVTLRFTSDKHSSLSQESSVYLNPGAEETIIKQAKEGEVHYKKVFGLLSFTQNSDAFYLADKLYINLSKEGGNELINSGLSRIQNTDCSLWNMENEAVLSFRKKGILSITSLTQYSGIWEHLSLPAVEQSVGNNVLYQRFSLEGLSLRRNGWSFRFSPESSLLVLERNSLLQGLEGVIPGNLEALDQITRLLAGGQIELRHKRIPWETTVWGSTHYAFYNWKNSLKSGHVLWGVSANTRYITGRWEASLGIQASLNGPDIQELGNVLLLKDHYTLWRGRSSLLFQPRWEIDAEYKYREPISGWGGVAHFSYNKSRGFASAREIYDSYILGFQTNDTYQIESVSVGAELSKGMYSLNGKFSLAADYALSSSVFQQNGVLVKYVSHLFSPVVTISASLLKWWGLSSVVRADLFRYSIQGVDNTFNASITGKIKNTFRFGRAVSANITTDFYHHSEYGKTLFFPDVELVWKGEKGLRIRLEARNLMNVQEYDYVVVSPLLTSHLSYRIRPLTVCLGLDWQF